MKRLPPSSIEAEESLLAYCLLGNASEAVELVTANDFYRTAHQVIFVHISGLVKEGKEVSLLTVVDSLRNASRLEEVGGASYVAHLTDIPMSIKPETSADIIKRSSVRRNVIELCCRTADACYESDDIDEILGGLNVNAMEIEQRLSSDSWVHIGDVIGPLVDKWESQKGQLITGIPTGLIDIDRHLGGLQDQNLIIIAGRPSMGKTAIAIKMAKNAAERGIPVAFRSIEMSREQIVTRKTADESQVDGERFKSGQLDQSHWRKIIDAVSKLSNLPIFIDDKPTEHIQSLQRNIRQFIKRNGHSLVVIDYLQYIKGIKSDRADIEIGTITRGLKATARELKIPIVLLSQLSRNVENRALTDRRPKMADLRGSGEIEQDADVIAFLYRDEVYIPKPENKGMAEFIIEKNRDGKCSTVPLTWIAHRATFENAKR